MVEKVLCRVCVGIGSASAWIGGAFGDEVVLVLQVPSCGRTPTKVPNVPSRAVRSDLETAGLPLGVPGD